MRDWGWAPEYLVAMHRMLEQPVADDYVIAKARASAAKAATRLGWRACSKMADVVRQMVRAELAGDAR